MAEAVSGMTGSLQGKVTSLGNKGQQWIDTIIPPETRAKIMNFIAKFSTEKPMLASFIGSQIALTGLPLGLFVVMTISIAIFAILVALILGLIGAVLFIVFCVGVALIFLLPTLFIAIAVATFLWLWVWGGYYILKYFNEKPIPGIHTGFVEGISDQLGFGGGDSEKDLGAIKGAADGQGDPKGHGGDEKGGEGKTGGGEKKDGGQKKGGANGHADPKKAADVGKHAGQAKDAAGGAKGAAGGAAGTVTDAAGSAKGAVPGT